MVLTRASEADTPYQPGGWRGAGYDVTELPFRKVNGRTGGFATRASSGARMGFGPARRSYFFLACTD